MKRPRFDGGIFARNMIRPSVAWYDDGGDEAVLCLAVGYPGGDPWIYLDVTLPVSRLARRWLDRNLPAGPS